MIQRLRPFLGVVALVASGCASSTAHVQNVYDVQISVERYIASGAYDRDFARVVDDANAYLARRAKAPIRPAIVLDIDETSLSNWPAYKANGWVRIVNGPCDIERGPCGLRAWQALAQSKALAPTLKLARRAKQLGVAVFFISSRPAALREATERNLREQGYEWDEVILSPADATFASAVDFKAPERKKISERGYTIVLSLGDQESDLKGGYAERVFKLPNPVYFLP
jgi:predicted secreted acid phosphatase